MAGKLALVLLTLIILITVFIIVFLHLKQSKIQTDMANNYGNIIDTINKKTDQNCAAMLQNSTTMMQKCAANNDIMNQYAEQLGLIQKGGNEMVDLMKQNNEKVLNQMAITNSDVINSINQSGATVASSIGQTNSNLNSALNQYNTQVLGAIKQTGDDVANKCSVSTIRSNIVRYGDYVKLDIPAAGTLLHCDPWNLGKCFSLDGNDSTLAKIWQLYPPNKNDIGKNIKIGDKFKLLGAYSGLWYKTKASTFNEDEASELILYPSLVQATDVYGSTLINENKLKIGDNVAYGKAFGIRDSDNNLFVGMSSPWRFLPVIKI